MNDQDSVNEWQSKQEAKHGPFGTKAHEAELFQVTATFGNFVSREEAVKFKKKLLRSKHVIITSLAVKGSFK